MLLLRALAIILIAAVSGLLALLVLVLLLCAKALRRLALGVLAARLEFLILLLGALLPHLPLLTGSLPLLRRLSGRSLRPGCFALSARTVLVLLLVPAATTLGKGRRGKTPQ